MFAVLKPQHPALIAMLRSRGIFGAPQHLPPTMNSVTASAYRNPWLVQAKKGGKDAPPQSGPTAEERAAAIAALRARQQQKRRASQAADADIGVGIDSAAQPEVADLEMDGGGHGRDSSPAAIAPARYEPSCAVRCGLLIVAPFTGRTVLVVGRCI